MFQRLQKGLNLDFLDNKIAEEQEKQKQQQQRGGSPARRTPSSARRGSGRTASPSKRGGGSRLQVPDGKGGDGTQSATKGPDPDDFVIGDDASDVPSRSTTPAPVKEGGDAAAAEDKEQGEGKDTTAMEKGKGPQVEEEDGLPLEVRQKLARLDKLTAKYQGMITSKPLHRDWHLLFYSQNSTCLDLLRNYRNAHAHVAAIEPFEATLREHTPLTSISDPGALVEFLNQRSLQSDMVMQELKRVSGEHNEAVKERDQLKVKLEEAEKKAKEAFDEAAGLRKERDEPKSAEPVSKSEPSDPLGASDVKKPSFSAETKADDDTFFSYEDEVSRAKDEEDKETSAKIDEVKSEYESKITDLQSEVKQHLADIDELSTENASMRVDILSLQRELDDTRLNLDAMENKHDVRDRNDTDAKTELSTLKEQLHQANSERTTAQNQEQEAAASLARTESDLANLQDRLNQYQKDQEHSTKQLKEKLAAAEAGLKSHQDKSGSDKDTQSLQRLIDMLKEKLKAAQEAKKETESKFNDMQLEINRLESESDTNANTIRHLRESEAGTNSLKKELDEAKEGLQKAQKTAETVKKQEATMASLRSQLKRAADDRDTAYQIIIDCGGKCAMPEDRGRDLATPTESSSTPETRSRVGSESTEISTQPTEVDSEPPATPSAEGGELAPPGDAKKKNKKKKSKAKKKAPAEGAIAISTEKADLTVEDLLLNPELAPDVLLKSKFPDNPLVPIVARMAETLKERSESNDHGFEDLQHHLEEQIEKYQQEIRDTLVVIRDRDDRIQQLEVSSAKPTAAGEGSEEQTKQIQSLKKEIATLREQMSEKDAQISKLQERLQGESVLQEKIDDLTEEKESANDNMIEYGKAATDAKHEVKELTESRKKLQEEFDELQRESDGHFKKMKDAEAQKETLNTRATELELEIQQLKTKTVSSDEVDGLKEQWQNANKEKESLQVLKDACEKQIEDLKAQHSASGAEVDAKHKALSSEFDALRSKTSELEQELTAANKLAQTRFKDLTAVREQYNKVQPELKRLREESAELKNVKAELEKASTTIKKLEAKEKDLRSEIAEYKSQMTEKDTEIASLREKSKKSDERSTALEESYETARKDLEKSEKTRDDAIDARERLEANIKKLEDEVKKSRSSLEELDSKAKKSTEEARQLREELDMKTGEYASAKTYMESLQDGSRELATQMKEMKQRCENLEEELESTHRSLSERSQDGEKMRRLLDEANGRAESAVKEMRERMDLAIEERDRAEDEASTVGRRKAREIEDLKTRLRDAEREASRATEAKEDAERRERDFKSRQDELERRAAQAQEEISEVRTAMSQLRDTLDETERQSHDLEKQKQELRRMVDEKDARLEKLTKSSKSMAEELRAIQAAKKQAGSSTPSRSSIDSSRVTSPVPKSSNGSGDSGIDYVYLKNVLLQFMETKEKKHQMQFVPVLRMLLRFTPEEEAKWQAVVSAK
ncbi:hypothetical protein PRZ48_013217 [Zasmidium cellare]|uniref:GRIP domain-containing protein n=1 Tax=Zasmidium cellare TaxID=395010 RepID=A0ABR0E3E9_ZASCE|nr:hypothetical protein PRZ48_013217 [Zasmidium cellare]